MTTNEPQSVNLGTRRLAKLRTVDFPNADAIVRNGLLTAKRSEEAVDIMLVNPPTPDGELWIRTQHRVGRRTRENMIWPQVSLAQMAALLHPVYKVKVVDCNAERMGWPEFTKMLDKYQPKYYLTQLTAPTLENDIYGCFLAHARGAKTIAFGTHITPLPLETMRPYPSLDFALVGEPDLTIRDLLDHLENKIEQRSPEVQKIFAAMKKYGLIVADNGTDMYITGTFDIRWNNDILNPAFGALTAGDFEVVQLGWQPTSTQVSVASVGVNPASVIGGQVSTGTVALTGPAPSGGAVVALSSANTAVASVPSSVTVAAGATSASFTVTTSTVSVTTLVGISSSSGGVTKTATLTVAPAPALPRVATLTVSPSTVTGGASSTGTVKLSGPAPSGGAAITLTTSNTIGAVPQAVVVAAGKSSAKFTVTTRAVNTNRQVVITAAYNGSSQTATLYVRPRTN
jgi:hypothetical protein